MTPRVREVEDIHLPETNSLHLKIDSLEKGDSELGIPMHFEGAISVGFRD